MPEQVQAQESQLQGQGQQEDQGSFWDRAKWVLLAFFVFNGLSNYFMGGKQPGQSNNSDASGAVSSSSSANGAAETTLYPMWGYDTRFNLELSVSDKYEYTPDAQVITTIEDASYADKTIDVTKNVNVPVPSGFVERNGTLWAHVVASKVQDPAERGNTFHAAKQITYYHPQPKRSKKKHLIGGPSDDDGKDDGNVDIDEAGQGPLIVPHFHPNISLGFVETWDPILLTKTHPAAAQHFVVDPDTYQLANDGVNSIGYYYPVIYNNEFWQLRSQMQEINSTVKSIPYQFSIYQTAFWKFQVMSSMDFGLKEQAKQGAAGTAEMEEVKRVLLETNPILLGVTIAVSLLHTLFEFLAFKNDISHWRSKKDTIGVSVRTIVANVVMQTVIFLYLMDNNDNTNSMVLLTQGLGIFVEAWKITKAVDIRFNVNGKWVEVTDKHELTDVEKKTKEYDETVFRYLYMVAVPLIGAYAVYSLLYEQHKSWVSFCITVAVQCVYAYGFLLLIPPVYINYRLKSVAHMSMRAMIYKTLNTFIDDLFSFVIKMPWLHRIMTLRDDVIFVIYLYQSWAYRVDYSRVNELGQGGAEEDGDGDDKAADEKKETKKSK